MKHKTILIIFILLFLLFLPACKSKEVDYDEAITKIKVGMSEKEVLKIMGKDYDYDEINQGTEGHHIYYWFNGSVSTVEEANKLYTEKGIYTKYYCVILYSSDLIHYTVYAKEDILSGNWGKS